MKVMVEVPPETIGLVPNALAIVGFPMTVRFAVFDPVPAVGVSVVVTPLAVLGCTPGVLEVTTTVMVQTPPLVPLSGRVNPLRLSEVAPSLRLLLFAPAQVPPAFWAPLTVMSVRVSVKLAPVSAVAFGLVSVKVMVEVPPATIGLVPNALAIVGLLNTVKFAVFDPVPAVGVSAVVTPLAVLG